MAAARKPGPAEADLLSDLRALRLAETGVLVQLAVRLARRVDSGKFTASDAQQLRLTWAAIREEGRPAAPTGVPDQGEADGTTGALAPPMTALEAARARREDRGRDGGAR
jgi:hypothetical protein